MGRARGGPTKALNAGGELRSATQALAETMIPPRTPADAFAGVIGSRRGALRPSDDITSHEALRDRASKLRGHTFTITENSQPLSVRPICTTALYRSYNSFEFNGELGYEPSQDIWFATLHTGFRDAKTRWLLASGPRLAPVLEELAARIEKNVSKQQSMGRHCVVDESGPVHSDSGPAVITEQTVRSRLDRIEALQS